jgi:hypothetical protein
VAEKYERQKNEFNRGVTVKEENEFTNNLKQVIEGLNEVEAGRI